MRKKYRSFHNHRHISKFPPPCTADMKFEECELAILRQAVDENDKMVKNKIANTDDVKNMIHIVEEFLVKTKCICYGGTAINNILPEEAQFYDRNLEIPDYDFFSMNPVEHVKQLADIFHEKGYADVEAKAGVHYGTYKLFVNFIPMADITYLHKDIYDPLQKDAIRINGVYYTPPNYLRMSMFLELSRPQGDLSRWEKVLKRLTLLNQYYPLKSNQCHQIDFQRTLENSPDDSDRLYYLVRDSFIDQRVVFFGGYATSLYARYMPEAQQRLARSIPDFDVLCDNPTRCATIIQQHLAENGFSACKIIQHDAIGDVIPPHYQVLVNADTIAFIYQPIACHNYNELRIEGRTIRVATIDTILSFYLAFLYTNRKYFNHYKDRLLCMSQFLFDVEQHNRLSQNGLLKRFTMSCYGSQPTLETIRAEKAKKFQELRDRPLNDPEKEAWFLKYNPALKIEQKLSKQNNKSVKNKRIPKKRTRKNTVSRKSDYFF